MKERIQKLIDIEQLSPSKFADTIGVQRSSVSHILSGRNKPSLDVVQKILIKFPDLNSDWLLFGNGEIYKTKKANTLFDNQNSKSQNNIKEENEEQDKNHEEEQNKSKTDNLIEQNKTQKIINKIDAKDPERIIIFFNDKTFSSYLPSE